MDEKPSIAIPGIKLAELLGRGASAEVWAGVDGAGQAVAIKIYTHSGLQKAAFDEAGALARVEHPNVIKIRAVHRTEAAVAVVMERCATTVAEHVASHGPLRGAQTVGLIAGMCRGLEALHRAGLVHGDISPNNVGLTVDGAAQLLDFGASRDPLILGTPGFGHFDAGGRDVAADGGGGPLEIEQRMRRLLGSGGDREISTPTGLERARADVLVAARVGLFALNGASDSLSEPPVGRGSVVGAVHAVLTRFLEQHEGGSALVQPQDLATLVREVIPPAPIAVAVSAASVAAPPIELTRTRRAGHSAVEEPSDDLWSDPPETTAVAQEGPQPRKINRKRSAALATLSIAGLIAIGGGVALGMGEEPVDDLAVWQGRVSELGQRREAAIVDRDAALLAAVNAPNSPAARADNALIDYLHEAGVVVTDFTTATTVQEVSKRSAEAVTLVVDTQVLSQQREIISDSGGQGIAAARALHQEPPEQLALELQLVDGQWLVYDVRE